MSTFVGKDIFGEKVCASRGSNGTMIFAQNAETDEGDEGESGPLTYISLDAESALALAKWIQETNP